MEEANLINEYVCEKCKGATRTVNRDAGTTPFLIRCRAQPPGVCDAMAQSSFYRVDQTLIPNWEWIKPTPEEFDRYIKDHKYEAHRDNLAEHVANGGLLLCKLDGIGRERHGYKVRQG